MSLAPHDFWSEGERFAFPVPIEFPPHDPEQGITEADLEAMIRYESTATPYVGLRDVWAENPAALAENLKACERDNAWPDWLAFINRWITGGYMADAAEFIDNAIARAKWPQTSQDVVWEALCRNNGWVVASKGGDFSYAGETLSLRK